MSDPGTVTRLLGDWAGGDKNALDQLIPLVYDELRRIASRYMAGEAAGRITLQPTALINEAYLRLVGTPQRAVDRGHFFAIAARVMRHVLVDYAKGRNRDKRGGGMPTVSMDALRPVPAVVPAPEDVIALHEALSRFEAIDAYRSRLFELHFYGGLTQQEIAADAGVSLSKANRDLRSAKAWLGREFNKRNGDDT